MNLALAVCLDGTVPAYHLHRGYGSGVNSWLIKFQVCETNQKIIAIGIITSYRWFQETHTSEHVVRLKFSDDTFSFS